MANIQVSETPNSINVVFNNMAPFAGFVKASFYKNQLTFQYPYNIKGQYVEDFVRVYDERGVAWLVTYNGNPNLHPSFPVLISGNSQGAEVVVVDSVDNVAPTDNLHLYDLLETLRG